METIKEILSAPSKWELAPRENLYSCDQVIDAYLKGKSDGIQQAQKLIARQLDDNLNTTVASVNQIVEHLKLQGFHPIAAYVKIENWDNFIIMVTIPDNEWCDPAFLNIFDYVFEIEETSSNDLYNLDVHFCGISDESPLNEPYVFSDGFILKLRISNDATARTA
jgi:hypothetical protein